MAASSPPQLTIGLCGLGVVGGGLLKILKEHSMCGRIIVKKVLVKDFKKHKKDELPDGCQFVADKSDILEDEDINCVVELIGANETGKSIIFEALSLGKHVVTGNKVVLAKYINELQGIVESKKGQVGLYYETAICGGIPIVNVVKRGLACDKIEAIAGIFNGTTNYILSQMGSTHCSFSQALEGAQKLGYAEADATSDIEGHDARDKLILLTNIALGFTADASEVYCEGISSIKLDDFGYASSIGHTIKLVATCERRKLEGEEYNIAVSPMLVPSSHILSNVTGDNNAVLVTSSNLGKSYYIGAGAGAFPSANSAAADIKALLLQATQSKGNFPLPFHPLNQLSHPQLSFSAMFSIQLTIPYTVQNATELMKQILTMAGIHQFTKETSEAIGNEHVFRIKTEVVQANQVMRLKRLPMLEEFKHITVNCMPFYTVD